MFLFPFLLSMGVFAYLYHWKERRKLFHVVPWLLAAIAVWLFAIEYGTDDLFGFGAVLTAIFVGLHGAIVWELFLRQKNSA